MRASAVVETNVCGGPLFAGAVEIGLRRETREQALAVIRAITASARMVETYRSAGRIEEKIPGS
jgi:hypothetical protein